MILQSSDGTALSRIGQGTWDLPESGPRKEEAIAALRLGVQLGLTHIDTAEMYGSGRVESIVGEAIRPLRREQLFLTSKLLPSHASYDETLSSCEASLQRLGTNYLDLYLLHWPSEVPFTHTARALRRLRDEGLIRAIGVSNFDLPELREACETLGDDMIACNQVLYHLCERGPESHLLPFCRDRGIALVGYTPFGRGAYRSRGEPTLAEIADHHNVTQSQVVLAFLTREAALFAIPKAARLAHVRENAAALHLHLTDDEIDVIDAAYPRGEDGPLATL